MDYSKGFHTQSPSQTIKMSRESRSSNENRIYVGNLPPDIRTKDVEDLFYRFGKIVFVDLKNRRGKQLISANGKKQQKQSVRHNEIFNFH